MADGIDVLPSGSASGSAANPAGRARRRLGPRFAVAILLAAAVCELAGRAYGLHQPVIYEATAYGYRVAPNQDARRFGHSVHYNALGLRNDAVTPTAPAGVMRVLCLGDSVTNGGAITDQVDTIPYRLEALLRLKHGRAEVLNASAPGWAISNELGWLSSYGTLDSQFVVLVISTHDLFQPLAASSVIDSHPSFPSRRPLLALEDMLRRYLLPRLMAEDSTADPGAAGVAASGLQARKNRDDILAIDGIVRQGKGRLMVAFLEQGRDNSGDTATLGAKRELFSLLDRHAIPVVTLGSEVESRGRDAMFRDDVHPNPAGNLAIAETIARGLGGLTGSPQGSGLRDALSR